MVPCCNWAYFKPEAYIVNLLEDKQVSEKITYSSLVTKITLYILKTAKE